MKIWNKIPIKDNGDKLIAIPSCLKFLDPHPYSHLGAPYEDKASIWKLREGVINRLVKVNDYLISKSSFQLFLKWLDKILYFPKKYHHRIFHTLIKMLF